MTTGTTPAASGVIVTVTFGKTWGAAPSVLIQPKTTATQALVGTAVNPTVTATSTTTWTLTAGATNLTASTTYVWWYQAQA